MKKGLFLALLVIVPGLFSLGAGKPQSKENLSNKQLSQSEEVAGDTGKSANSAKTEITVSQKKTESVDQCEKKLEEANLKSGKLVEENKKLLDQLGTSKKSAKKVAPKKANSRKNLKIWLLKSRLVRKIYGQLGRRFKN